MSRIRRQSSARRVGRASVVVVVVGWLAIAIGVDFGLGSAFTALRGPERASSEPDAAETDGQIEVDPRADSPALAPYPWAEDYLDELQLSRYDFEPFVVAQLRDRSGAYINTSTGMRGSYQPAAVAEGEGEALDVWFFGGSTTFGEGQRDEWTIPSYVTRLAEADGIVVRPFNFGHQGDVSWQELLRFESELARRGPPDLAVFYDGVNDYNLQLAADTGQPTHDQLALTEDRLGGANAPLPGDREPPPASVWRRYEETSILGKVLDQVVGLASIPAAGAQQGTASTTPPTRRPPEVQAAQVLGVYGRAEELRQLLADTAGVTALSFWQPVRGDTPGYEIAARSLPGGVIDITDAFDAATEPIFLDGAHTNELGARLSAEAMYPFLRPLLVAAEGSGVS